MTADDEHHRPRHLPPEHEFEERFILTGGPGGQHVNRTESGVQLRFDVGASGSLGDEVKARLLKLAGRRADRDGVITIEATRFRSQPRNRADARERLAALIEQASRAPRKRIPTRPTRAAKKRRVDDKKHRARIKARRGTPPAD